MNVVGDGETVLVLAPEPPEALVALLATRFRTVVPELDDRAVAALDDLEVARCAVVAVSSGADEAMALALDDRVDALVLLSPLGIDEHLRAADKLAAWEFPVLIFAGEDDPLIGAETVEALNDAIPSSTLGLLPGCSHDLLTDAPETLLPMIQEYLRARYLHEPHGHGAEGVAMLQLERRPPWVDLEPYLEADDEPAVPPPEEQEVGPSA